MSNELEFRLSGPSATLFEQRVQSQVMLLSDTPTTSGTAGSKLPTIEWVVAATDRLWIVRMTQYELSSVTKIRDVEPYLQSLTELSLSSTSLQRGSGSPTTITPGMSPTGAASILPSFLTGMVLAVLAMMLLLGGLILHRAGNREINLFS
ncbi:MAG: hypothetical protein ABI670_11590 [Chloroflexota bacterium]